MKNENIDHLEVYLDDNKKEIWKDGWEKGRTQALKEVLEIIDRQASSEYYQLGNTSCPEGRLIVEQLKEEIDKIFGDELTKEKIAK